MLFDYFYTLYYIDEELNLFIVYYSTFNFQLKRKKRIKINIIWIIIIIVIFAITILVKTIKKNTLTKKEKIRQFECGFLNINPTHLPFSYQFFLIAILFLIFDVEISMVLSYPIEKISTKNIIIIILFLIILIIGLFYEWQKSKINW